MKSVSAKRIQGLWKIVFECTGQLVRESDPLLNKLISILNMSVIRMEHSIFETIGINRPRSNPYHQSISYYGTEQDFILKY
jgi:hypothetical protein